MLLSIFTNQKYTPAPVKYKHVLDDRETPLILPEYEYDAVKTTSHTIIWNINFSIRRKIVSSMLILNYHFVY